MNLRTYAIALLFALLAAFSLLNWVAFTTPTPLTLGFVDVQAPLGLIMLMFTALISGLFLVYIVYQQASSLMEARRTAKELKLQRELADKAEASRFTELRSFLTSEMGTLRDKLEESTRTLSAYIGEVEDKLDRALTPPRG
jgi:uncharacterized integral membrane protein